MLKKLFSVFVSALACLLLSSSVATIPPDPELFSKKLFEVIKKNNPESFVQTFEISDADIDLLLKLCSESPYLSAQEKERVQNEFTERAEIKDKLKERLNTNFEKIQEWIASDSIFTNNIEYLVFYYNIELEKRSPFHIIHSGELFIKHGKRFYKIEVEDVVYINNQWKYGEINSIEEVDKQLNAFEYSGYAESAVDSVAVVDAYEYDTAAAVVDTAYYYDPVYFPETYTDKQSKKANKIQKKIDALYAKKDKLYAY